MNTRLVMVTVLGVAWLFTDIGIQQATAQQRERMIGGGRIMRKIFGLDSEDEKKPQQPSKSTRSSAKTPKGVKTPTLAKKPSQNSRPTQPLRAATPAQPPKRDARTRANVPTRTQADTARVPQQPTRSNAQATEGFGMRVEQRGESLVVRQIDGKGNAAEAGIKRGDIILNGGGVEFSTVDEFNQITEILKNGDQLEFEIERRGKKEKLLIQFGEASAAPENQPATSGDRNGQPSSLGVLNSELKVNAKDHFSFVPTDQEQSQPGSRRTTTPRSGSPMRSVLGNVVLPTGRTPSGETSRPTMRPITPIVTPTRPATSSREAAYSDQLRRQLKLQQQEIERLRNQLRESQQKETKDENDSDFGLPELSGPGQ